MTLQIPSRSQAGRLVAAAMLLTLGLPAHAQNVIQVQIEGQPLVYVSAGKVTGCGVRMYGGTETGVPGKLKWFDVSANFNITGPSLVKALAYDVSLKEVASGKGMKNAPVKGAWLKVDGADGTSPIGGRIVSAEDKGGIIYAADDELVAQVIGTVLAGQTVMIGVRRSDENRERIYAGVPLLTDSDKARLMQCMQDGIRQLDAAGLKSSR